MIKRMLACLLPLLIAACFNSAPPQIAAADLAYPEDLDGQYWSIGNRESGSIDAIGFGHRPAGLVTIDSNGSENPFRLISILPPDLYLLVDDESQSRSTYYFLRRSGGGSWMVFDINVPQDDTFGDAHHQYLDRIARRHGLSIGDPDDSTEILGDVSKGAIPELFRDRAFLGGLAIGTIGVYLPAGGKFAKPQELSLNDSEIVGFADLRIERPLAAGSALADPVDLAGRYFEGNVALEVRRSGPGVFLYGPEGKPDKTISLLPFNPSAGRYLAVAERTDQQEKGPVVYRDLELVERTDYGWTIIPIKLVSRPFLPELDQTIAGMMTEAAKRSGLGFAQGQLNGAVNPANLVALLRDGQFIAGLRVTRDLQQRLVRPGAGKAN